MTVKWSALKVKIEAVSTIYMPWRRTRLANSIIIQAYGLTNSTRFELRLLFTQLNYHSFHKCKTFNNLMTASLLIMFWSRTMRAMLWSDETLNFWIPNQCYWNSIHFGITKNFLSGPKTRFHCWISPSKQCPKSLRSSQNEIWFPKLRLGIQKFWTLGYVNIWNVPK